MLRETNGRYFLGHVDHRIGPSVIEITEEKAKKMRVVENPPKPEPYTESQIKTFENLSLESLEQWVSRGT